MKRPTYHPDDSRAVDPMHEREPRAPLPARPRTVVDDPHGMTHEQLVAALRAVNGLVDVGHAPPNFHFRSQPFLHFHTHAEGMYANVRFGSGDFEPVWVATAQERQELLARVCEHVEELQRSKKEGRGKRARFSRRSGRGP